MASKKDQEGKDEYEFEVPDFDEDAFIHKEMVSFRTTSILFALGIITALISWGIYEAVDGARIAWLVGLVLMAAVAYGLRYLYPALKVDIRHFGRREWFGTFFLFFFAWLSFFILFLNPPISDHADPTVDVFVSPATQVEGGDVTIDLFVADNYRIDTFAFQVLSPTGDPLADRGDLIQDLDYADHHNVTLTALPAGSYTYVATATDGKGTTNSTSGSFRVVPDPVDVILPDDGTLDLGDEVFVLVPDQRPCAIDEDTKGYPVEIGDCILNVVLRLGNGETVVMDYSDGDGAWQAKHTYVGWSEGNNSFTVDVQFQDRFHNIERIPGGHITSTGHSIDVPVATGDVNNLLLATPHESPLVVTTPGFEVVAGVAVLVGAVAIARRRHE